MDAGIWSSCAKTESQKTNPKQANKQAARTNKEMKEITAEATPPGSRNSRPLPPSLVWLPSNVSRASQLLQQNQ